MSARLALLIAAGLLPGHAIAQSFVTLAREHVDVLVMDRPGTDPRLGIALRNGDTGAVLDPATTVLEVGEAGRLEVPPGLEIFGPAGSSLWVLPQSQDPALPYLGISASGISQAAWQPRFDIQLLRVEGPGHFFAWQFDPFSGLEMRMNSRDGIGPDDVLSPLLGGHEHVNWGFTATGLHRVELKVSGRLAGSTNVVSSDPVTLLFGVTPYSLPAAPAVLSAPRHAGDRFACRLLGSPARSYRVEASANLLEWTTVATVTTDASGAAGVDAPGTGGARFYRATSAP
jgi:surface-anchored protein